MCSNPARFQLENIQGFLLDLDGVLWLDKETIPGAKEAILYLQSLKKNLMYVSNTSSRSREEALAQFQRMGIPDDGTKLYMASEQTARYLGEIIPGGTVYCVGSLGLVLELKRAGLRVFEGDSISHQAIDFVVIGKDKKINYQKLSLAAEAIRLGAQFVAVNLDVTVPGLNSLEPGAGAIAAAISAMVGRPPDITMGKPSTLLLELALKQTGLNPSQCVMVGDTLEADIAAGNQLGMTTILVLTGNASLADAKNLKDTMLRPTFVLSSVAKLSKFLGKGVLD